MSIHVEFFGIVKQRAGIDSTLVETNGDEIRLGDVLAVLAIQLPALVGQCIYDQRLLPGFTANVDGEKFVTDAETLLRDGSSLLIMSTDAGG